MRALVTAATLAASLAATAQPLAYVLGASCSQVETKKA